MITSKAQMINVMKNCDDADTLTRLQKFEVFCRVCDNMLESGRLSKAKHKQWTEIWQSVPVGEVAIFPATASHFMYIKRVKGTPLHMRKIETLMNDAIANNKDWQSGNTSVSYNEENGVSVVRLHGNKIAEVGDDYLQIFDGGWQSNTTKSRLNAMIDRFCDATTDGVFQKDYCWFIRDNNVTRDFDNGYIFA